MYGSEKNGELSLSKQALFYKIDPLSSSETPIENAKMEVKNQIGFNVFGVLGGTVGMAQDVNSNFNSSGKRTYTKTSGAANTSNAEKSSIMNLTTETTTMNDRGQITQTTETGFMFSAKFILGVEIKLVTVEEK